MVLLRESGTRPVSWRPQQDCPPEGMTNRFFLNQALVHGVPALTPARFEELISDWWIVEHGSRVGSGEG